MGPELEDNRITQYSLISLLEYLQENVVKDKTKIQQLHKVKLYSGYLPVFTDLVQKILVVTYNVYIASHLNLELEFLKMDESEKAHEWFRQRARSLALNNTEMSLYIPE